MTSLYTVAVSMISHIFCGALYFLLAEMAIGKADGRKGIFALALRLGLGLDHGFARRGLMVTIIYSYVYDTERDAF